ncbi:CheY chemotaxis protein or a CheY-like REC (receiver) domain [Thermosyntropha lipolytica DSM 11003]|uniref:Stage 0 sporulation protein A homolog n=1 Tax=Thermosyntropha lipolytica DSM 11003 TaxID=1123382 RepID=A0A1M5SIP3_9FIRM|nr:response regulator [Thermosyntropha lipolytica]SHH38361.1 CheY chemotaxis protein or a CheY-like REC (receiver) domain [Thermosyntropha lipolytica DSM 11003]
MQFFDFFAQSLIYTASMLLNAECQLVKTEQLSHMPSDASLHIMLGITGDVYGHAVLSFTEATALKTASAMMGGMSLSQLDEISLSALKEFLNVAAGGAATRMYEIQKKIDLTPPTLISGSSIYMQMAYPLVSFLFQIKDKDINLRLSLSLQETKARTILIVDDSSLLRRTAQDVLTKAGFDVVAALSSGEECLDYLSSHPAPEIILLDIVMPGMDGIEVLKEIRSRQLKTKVVIFTSIADRETVQKATAVGVDGYMLKPISEGLLVLLKNI